MEIKSIKEIYEKSGLTYNPDKLTNWIDEIKRGLENEDDFFMEKPDVWKKELEDMEKRLEMIKKHKYYTPYYITYFHRARLVDHAPDYIKKDAVIHPTRRWGVLAKNTPFHYSDGVYSRAGKTFPYIRNSEYTELFNNRKEQIVGLYKFLLEKTIIEPKDFEIEENDNVILIYPKDKKGLFIGKKGINVKFVGEAIGKKVIIK